MPRKALHKDNLIQTTMRLFRRQGFAATGLQQIIDQSGAPKGSLYHYFPKGKEELAVAAVSLAGERVLDMFKEAFQNTSDAQGFINKIIKTYSQWMIQGAYTSGCPIATTMLECVPQSPSITLAGQKAYNSWSRIVAQVLKRDGMDTDTAKVQAEIFICALQGALILTRVQKTTLPLENLSDLQIGRM